MEKGTEGGRRGKSPRSPPFCRSSRVSKAVGSRLKPNIPTVARRDGVLEALARSPLLQQFWAPARHINFFYGCLLSHTGCEWLCSASSPHQFTRRGWKMLCWALHYTAPSVSAPQQLLALPATIALCCQRWSQGCLASVYWNPCVCVCVNLWAKRNK